MAHNSRKKADKRFGTRSPSGPVEMSGKHDYGSDPDPHIPLAHGLIQRVVGIGPSDQDYEDCLQVSRIAIWDCQRLHNPKQTQFSTYATKAIIRALWRWLELKGRNGFSRTGGSRGPRVYVKRPVSIFAQIGESAESGLDISQTLASRDVGDASDEVEIIGPLMSELAVRSPRLARVINERYFLGKTLRETAKLMGGLSRERIRQMEREALEWLRWRAEKGKCE